MCFHLFSLQDGVAADFTSLTKSLYDLHKAVEPADYKGSPLAQLVVENFDEEQIWQELELQNSAVLKHFKNVIDEALPDEKLTLLVEDDGENSEEELGTDDENIDEEEGEVRPPRRSKKLAPEAEDRAEDYTDEDSDLDFDVDALEKRENQKKHTERMGCKTKVVPSEVDDRFFKLSEMELFLDDMDKREGKEDGNEDDIDYFQELPSDEDDDLDLDQIFSTKKQKKNTVCIFVTLLIFHCVLMIKNTGYMCICIWIIVVDIDRQRAPGISSTRTFLMLWIANQLKQMSQMARMAAWMKHRKQVNKKWMTRKRIMMAKRRVMMSKCD